MTTGNPNPTKAITGGEFLIRDVRADEIFTPEEWTEEHRMMLQTGLDFVAQRIIPNLERIEAQEEGLTPKLLEEVGVSIAEVRYFTSQPWPFPSTLMIGCFAVAENLKLDVNLQELESAQWFNKKDVQQLFAEQNQEFSAPRPIAIAHHLIRHWLDNS